jgi:hypothetical protein
MSFNIAIIGKECAGKKTVLKSLIGNNSSTNTDVCKEVAYNGKNLFNGIADHEKVKFKFFMISDLGDNDTHKTAIEYLANNFYTFDCILYILDNENDVTPEDINIMLFVNHFINKIKLEFNKEIVLITICNKFDKSVGCFDNITNYLKKGHFDHYLCKKQTDTSSVKSDGSGTKYHDIKLEAKYRKNNNFVNSPIIGYSGLFTYVTRCIFENTNEETCKIEKSFLNVVGTAAFGELNWDEKMDVKNQINKIKTERTFDAFLKKSRYDILKKTLTDEIGKHMVNIMYQKINFIKDKSKFKEIYDKMNELNQMFNQKRNIDKYLDDYLEYLDGHYKFINISLDNMKTTDEYRNKLELLLSLDIPHSKIQSRVKLYNVAKADYNLNYIKHNNIDNYDDLVLKLNEMKDANCLKKIFEDDNIGCLQNASIEIFSQMIDYFKNENIDVDKLMKVYLVKVISHANASKYSKLIKNYVLRLFIQSHESSDTFNALDMLLYGITDKEHDETLMNNMRKNTDHLTHIKEFMQFINAIDDNNTKFVNNQIIKQH